MDGNAPVLPCDQEMRFRKWEVCTFPEAGLFLEDLVRL
jgi:hypothetical protein